MKKATTLIKKIPVLDIPGLGAFQLLHENEPDMESNGTRVTLLFDADEKFYKLAERYNKNEAVPVISFCNAQRQLKARMYSLKSQNTGGLK